MVKKEIHDNFISLQATTPHEAFMALMRQGGGGVQTPLPFSFEKKSRKLKVSFIGTISLGRVVEPSPIDFPGPMRNFSAKKNHIGSGVSDILWYVFIS